MSLLLLFQNSGAAQVSPAGFDQASAFGSPTLSLALAGTGFAVTTSLGAPVHDR